MKKANVLRLVLSVTLAAFLLCGCGNSKEAPAEEVPEVAAEEVTEENEVEEEQETVEEETSAGEEGAEEPSEEETSTDMPEAQVTTTVADITEFAQYMEGIDPKTPHIVIWNEAEGYVIDMGEGEHYQLKNGDRIFLNSNAEIRKHSYKLPELRNEPAALWFECIPDYNKFEDPQECIYWILTKDAVSDDEGTWITCYLDAPAE